MKKATRQRGNKATRPRTPADRDERLAELLGFDAKALAELLGRTRMRGGPGAHRLKDAADMVADLVYRRARALGMNRMDQAPRSTCVIPIPSPIAAQSHTRAREQMELEAKRRGASIMPQPVPPEVARPALSPQELLEHGARAREVRENLGADAERALRPEERAAAQEAVAVIDRPSKAGGES